MTTIIRGRREFRALYALPAKQFLNESGQILVTAYRTNTDNVASYAAILTPVAGGRSSEPTATANLPQPSARESAAHLALPALALASPRVNDASIFSLRLVSDLVN